MPPKKTASANLVPVTSKSAGCKRSGNCATYSKINSFKSTCRLRLRKVIAHSHSNSSTGSTRSATWAPSRKGTKITSKLKRSPPQPDSKISEP